MRSNLELGLPTTHLALVIKRAVKAPQLHKHIDEALAMAIKALFPNGIRWACPEHDFNRSELNENSLGCLPTTHTYASCAVDSSAHETTRVRPTSAVSIFGYGDGEPRFGFR